MVEYPVNLQVEYVEPASRAHLFIRIAVAIVWGIIAYVWGIIAGVCAVIQWFYILFLGKRSQGLYNFIKGFITFYVRLEAYLLMLTDEIPPISAG